MLGPAISFNIGTVLNQTAPVTIPVSHCKRKAIVSLPQMLTVPHIALLHRRQYHQARMVWSIQPEVIKVT